MSTIEVGSKIDGRYEIISLLGRGGMSVVYKSFDHVEKRLVAVKLILQDGIPDRRRLLRSKREELAASRLDHPCITKVYEYGLTDDQNPYLVMELVEGTTLAEIIARQGQLPLETTLSVFILICDGLAHAHENRILHRDLKPSNIMLNQDESQLPQVKILDFGIAKILDADRVQSPALTMTGELVGSPLYMSPEQARGKKLDHRSDLYSLGCTLYEALTGGPPHIADSAMSTLLKRETDQPLSMGEASLGRNFPAQLESIVAKLLKRDPNERYQSAGQVKDDLVGLFQGGEHDTLLEQLNTAAISDARRLKAIAFKNALRNTVPAAVLITALLISWTHFPHLLPKRQIPMATSSPSTSDDSVILPPIDTQSADEMNEGKYPIKNQEFVQSEANLLAEMSAYAQQHGNDTLEYASKLENLSKINALAGKRENAVQSLVQAVKIYEKRLASSDYRLLDNFLRLANALGALSGVGDSSSLEKSIELYDRAQIICDQYWPQKRMDVFEKMQATARNLTSEHHYVQAEALFKKAFALYQTRLGADCLEGADTLRWLARCYRAQGLNSQALACQRRAMAILKKSGSVEAKEWVDAYKELAVDQQILSLNHNKEKRQQAIDSLNQALNICQAAPEQFALQIADLQHRLGDCENQSAVERKVYSAAAYKRSENLYRQSFAVYKKETPPDYEVLANLCRKLYSTLKAQNRKIEATSYYEQSLMYSDAVVAKINKSTRQDLDVLARVAFNEGALHREAGKLDQALICHKKALDLRSDVYGLNSILCADALMDIGFDYQLVGKLDKAFKSYKTAFEIYKSDLGLSDYRTVRAKQNMNRVREQAGGRKRKLKTVKAGHREKGKTDIGDDQT